MSESGQKAKYSLRAEVLRFASESRRQGMPKVYWITLTMPASPLPWYGGSNEPGP
jgi:hypothetical protein